MKSNRILKVVLLAALALNSGCCGLEWLLAASAVSAGLMVDELKKPDAKAPAHAQEHRPAPQRSPRSDIQLPAPPEPQLPAVPEPRRKTQPEIQQPQKPLPVPAPGAKALACGISVYESFDYQRCVEILAGFRSNGGVERRQRTQACLYAGAAQYLLGQDESSRGFFRAALALDSGCRLDEAVFPPEIVEFFQHCRR